jgi:hypothetical protein
LRCDPLRRAGAACAAPRCCHPLVCQATCHASSTPPAVTLGPQQAVTPRQCGRLAGPCRPRRLQHGAQSPQSPAPATAPEPSRRPHPARMRSQPAATHHQGRRVGSRPACPRGLPEKPVAATVVTRGRHGSCHVTGCLSQASARAGACCRRPALAASGLLGALAHLPALALEPAGGQASGISRGCGCRRWRGGLSAAGEDGQKLAAARSQAPPGGPGPRRRRAWPVGRLMSSLHGRARPPGARDARPPFRPTLACAYASYATFHAWLLAWEEEREGAGARPALQTSFAGDFSTAARGSQTAAFRPTGAYATLQDMSRAMGMLQRDRSVIGGDLAGVPAGPPGRRRRPSGSSVPVGSRLHAGSRMQATS